jgi:hypothetical protein
MDESNKSSRKSYDKLSVLGNFAMKQVAIEVIKLAQKLIIYPRLSLTCFLFLSKLRM